MVLVHAEPICSTIRVYLQYAQYCIHPYVLVYNKEIYMTLWAAALSAIFLSYASSRLSP